MSPCLRATPSKTESSPHLKYRVHLQAQPLSPTVSPRHRLPLTQPAAIEARESPPCGPPVQPSNHCREHLQVFPSSPIVIAPRRLPQPATPATASSSTATDINKFIAQPPPLHQGKSR
ncbi:putative histone-lysine N-methyltransferase ATXR3 [Dorcoceras hygrometricum]|uniref:Putative histone-lysine N-methyltransferase ATXR3 n=1 Tax=Dorcoceras hygrometricum TaxID=472368 RepID=A0A2Z7BV56_9LAMI|nr:putative histone-lysine N-methyltransferase ATXR3 [Dorcoceras hygrometricum]